MTTEAIPKVAFINEDTEELIDKRLGRQQIIEQTSKRWEYKFKSQINLMKGYEIDEDDTNTSIFNIVYSNMAGLMIYNSNRGIVAYDINALEGIVKNGQKRQPHLLTKDKGSLFLSPKQTKLIIVNQKSIHVYSLDEKFTLIKTVPNEHKVTNACWQNQNQIYMWSFQNFLYNFSTLTGSFTKIEQIQKCTGVNRLGEKKIIVMQGIKVFIYEEKIRAKTLELQQKNKDCELFEFMTLIGIAKLNNLDKQELTPNDIYALVGIYYTAYEEDDEQPCHRYMFYMKGDLYEEDSLLVRGYELIMSVSDEEKLYLAEDKTTKLPFSCLFSIQDSFLVVLVEKNQEVFAIDSTEQFSKMGIFSTWPKHGYKLPFNLSNIQNNRYLKGMAPMRNMLPFESKPAPGDHISKIYCNEEFKGQFFRLYFSHKEADLTVQFPLSIIVVTHQYMFRKYAACINTYCEEDKDDQILKFVRQTKKSRYILPVTSRLQIEEEKKNDEEGYIVKIESRQSMKKEVKAESPKQIKQQKKQEQVKKQKEEKVQIKQKEPIQQKEVKQDQKQQTKPIPTLKIQQPKKDQTIKVQQKDKEQQKNSFGSLSKKIQIQPNNGFFNTANTFKGVSMFNNSKVEDQTEKNNEKKSNPPLLAFGGSTKPILAGGGSIFEGPDKTSGIFGGGGAGLTNLFGGINTGTGSIFGGTKTEKSSDPQKELFGNKITEIGSIFGDKKAPKQSATQIAPPPIPQANKSFGSLGNIQSPPDTTFGKGLNFSLGGASTAPFAMKPPVQSTTDLKPKDKEKIEALPTLGNKLFQPTETKVTPPPQIKKQEPILTVPTGKPPVVNNQEQSKKKLKEKLEYFANLAKSVEVKIQTYQSDQKAPELFNLQNAKKLLKNWNKIFDSPEDDSFDKISNVLRKMQKFEKFKNSKLFKNKNIEDQKKELFKKFKQVDALIGTICYFVSFFEATNGNQRRSVFGPMLKKPKIDAKIQQQKFIGGLAKRVKQLQKQAQNLSYTYKNKLASALQNDRKPSKQTKKYNFDAAQFESSQSDQEQQTQDQRIIQKLKNQKERRLEVLKHQNNNLITPQDLEQSLQRHQQRVEINQKPRKAFIFMSPLEQPVADLKKNSIPSKTKLSQPPVNLSSKPFDSKLNNLGIKVEEKKTIPNLSSTSITKQKQIVASQQGSDQEGFDSVPAIPARTISKLPVLGNDKKKVQPNKTSGFNLFGNAPISTSSIKQEGTAKKQDKQKPKQGFGLFPKIGGTPFGAVQSTSFGTGGLFGNTKKSQTKQPPKEQNKEQPKQQQKQLPKQSLKQPAKQQPKQQPKQQKKPEQPKKSLFSGGIFNTNTGGLGSGGLFNNTKPTATTTTTTVAPTTQPPKKEQTHPLFGQNKAPPETGTDTNTNKPIFGVSDAKSLFGNLKIQDDKSDKKQANSVPKPTVQPTKPSPFNMPANNTSTGTTTAPPVATTGVAPATTTPKTTPIITPTTITQPKTTEPAQNKPTETGLSFKNFGATQQNVFNNQKSQPTNPIFNSNKNFNNSTNNSFNNNNAQQPQQQQQQNPMQFNQNTSTIPGHASTQFGSGNRFMGSGQPAPQQPQQTGWNPNQMKFGDDSGNTGFKTFANVGGSSGNSWVNSGNTGQNNSWIGSTSTGNSWLNQPQNNQQPQQQPQQQQQGWANTNNNMNNMNSMNNLNNTNSFSPFPQQQQQQQQQPFQSNQFQPQNTATTPWAPNPTNMSSGTFQMSTNPMLGGGNINQALFQPRK